MTTITLEQLEAKHSELADLIAKFRSQPQDLPAIISFSAEIALAAGEHYAGLVLRADGTPSHHLVLLPGEGEDLEWEEAKAWALEANGELPTRQEQALLYANCKAQFQPTWYWSSEPHETNSSYAWCQYFDGGSQDINHENNSCRARAVRRFAA